MAVNYAQTLGLGKFDPIGAGQEYQQNAQSMRFNDQAMSIKGLQHDQDQIQAGKDQVVDENIGAAYDGDPTAIRAVAQNNPEFFKFFTNLDNQRIAKLGAEKAEIQKRNTINFLSAYKNASPEQRVVMDAQAIADPTIDWDDEDTHSQVQGGNNQIVDMALYGLMGDKAYEQFYGGSGGQDDLPAEAKGFNDLIKDFTPQEKADARRVKAGLKGRAMSNAMITALENGSFGQFKDASAELKEAEKFAEMTGSSRAKVIDKGFESIAKIDSATRNIDKAIGAVNLGAGVGPIEKLWPSITAASVQLDNVRGQMALDVVGATTFGALSKGELDLAKDIALPTGLGTEALLDHLKRTRAAQEKLRGYLMEQIQHIDEGGTVASFLRMKEKSMAGKDKPVAWDDL
jgi:hypothetical protein